MHGRDFKPSAEVLEEISTDALRAGIARDFPDRVAKFDQLNLTFTYYGDLTNALLREEGRHYDEAVDIGDRRNALAALKEISARKRFGIRQYDRLSGKSALGEFAADTLAPILGVFGLWLWACRRLTRDFAAYLSNDVEYRNAACARLRRDLIELLARGDKVLLLTHGTGSAVAWDVLWELSHDEAYRESLESRKVELWATLGSPLGDRQLRKRLRGAREKGVRKFPTNVIALHNVSAEDDYTCHDKTLADDLKKMMREHVVSLVTDYKIYNHAVRYGRSNPHSSVGYLIHPRVSKIVADWLAE